MKMLPFKKILCPTDFSEPSYEAIKTAGEMAFHFGSELCILHVVSPVPVVPMGGGAAFNVPLYEQELEVSSRKSLEEIINQLEWKELKVRLIVVRGNAADEIVGIADQENVDLIVIASRGRTGLDRLIFGSVAEKVVRLARCPVLTVAIKATSEEGEETLTRREVLGLSEKKEIRLPEAQEKKAYQEKIEAQLKEWGAKIDELKAKVDKSKADVKSKYEKQIEDLQTKQAAVQQKLRELRDSGEETWEGLKTGLEKGLDELKDDFDRTISKFKKMEEKMTEKVSGKKKAYVEKMEAQLKEWGGEIDVLKAKAEKSKAEVKIAYLKQIEELKKKQASVKKNLRELRGSGDEAWEDFKGGVEDAVKDLKRALKRAASRFKKR
jgi:nucleotide-binding universal stress UspA family protein